MSTTRLKLRRRTLAALTVTGASLALIQSAIAVTITLDGTSGSNTSGTNYSTDGGLDIDLGFFTQYLIVGGGGGGGNGTNSTNNRGGGGGGAGGLLTNVGGSLLQVNAASHSVVVGAGGIANGTNRAGSNGGDSSFASITALGGGGGGGQSGGNAGKAGGSGGGGAGATSTSGLGGAGTPGQGNNGGNGDRAGAGFGGGGGGAGQAGRNGQNSTAVRGGYGGDGLQNDITGINLYYAGGGGGRDSGGTNPDSGEGGLGGGGDAAQPGIDGLGGGGGGGLDSGAKNGGSGVVVIRYAGSQAGTGGAISTVGGDTVHQFTSVGNSALDLSGLDLDARLGLTLTGTISGGGDLTYNGPGRLTLAANNTYTGATIISAGTLLVNGSLASSAVTVNSGGTFGGTGTIGGATTINGLHTPGNSPGIQTFASDLTYNSGASVLWELTNNTNVNAANPNAIFDTIVVGGNLNFAGPTTLDLSFIGNVDWTDTFWGNSHLGTAGWLVYDVAGTTSNFDNLSIITSGLDSNNVAFNTVHPLASFSLFLDGNDIYLNFSSGTVAAIPEPATATLGLLAFGGLMMRRRRMG